jgi:hypothetical protein
LNRLLGGQDDFTDRYENARDRWIQRELDRVAQEKAEYLRGVATGELEPAHLWPVHRRKCFCGGLARAAMNAAEVRVDHSPPLPGYWRVTWFCDAHLDAEHAKIQARGVAFQFSLFPDSRLTIPDPEIEWRPIGVFGFGQA